MKKVLGAAAIAALMVAGSAASASAATTLQAPGVADFGATHVGSKGGTSFTDSYSFTLPSLGDYDLSVTNSFSTLAQKIKNFTLTLFFPGGSSVSPVTVSTGANIGKQTAELLGSLAKGTYTFTVSGVYSTAGGSYGGSLATNVSAVPLPGSVAMFGAAVVALGAAGALRRKGAKSATVAG